MKLTLYGKAGCCLCDEAKAAVAEVREDIPFDFEEVDISLDPRLHREYGERIPVIEVNGKEAFELGVDAAALRNLLGTVQP
ncbi:MAG: glutaredoxin family protein [Thermoleophilaceae bacterium]|nr:glutaredoxin family protein [Thermoleophilaceae bacterium]